MSYFFELQTGDRCSIQNLGHQTVINLSYSSGGQQQQSSISLTTGAWNTPPTAFYVNQGAIAQISGSQGTYYVYLQSGQLQSLPIAPDLTHAQSIPLQEDRGSVAPPLPPLPPLPPMTMGGMQMQMTPMEMRMGDRVLRMDTASPRRFCSQCGAAVQASDRFCASCGHALS